MRTADLIKDSLSHSPWRRGFLLIPLALTLAWRSFHGKNIQSPLRSLASGLLPSAAAILALLLSTPSSSFAGSATWKASPTDENWNSAGNWTPATVPNAPANTATFATSKIRSPIISQTTEVNGIVFNPGASAFTITSPFFSFTISGAGITNNSGIIQNFVSGPTVINFTHGATAGSLTHFTNTGDITFGDSATAGNADFTNNAGLKFGATSTAGNATVTNNAEVLFFGNSTAGNATFTNAGGIVIFSDAATADDATFTNAGGAVSGTGGGFTVFHAGSTAGNATVISNGAMVSDAFKGENLFEGDAGSATLIANGGLNGGEGGFIQYRLGCTGGRARVEVFGNGTLDISQHDAPGVSTGSIQGNGLVFLGGVNLTVGTNNLSTTFSGLIQDGGFSGGTGGSLTKTGTGTLTLSSANTYTGGTLITTGTLQASQDGALGEGDVAVTGSGAILRLQTGATNNYIADAATLNIVSGSTVDLNFNGAPDTVRSLIVDGVGQLPGLYGSAASGAPNQLPQFGGMGTVLVKMLAVSRKTHGAAGDFDINLPFGGGPAVECRGGGVDGDYQVVVTFINPVTLDGAAVSEGTGMVSSITGNGTTVVTVSLTGVTDRQRILVNLSNVNDGTTTETIPIPMGMLIGDTNGDGVVNAGDSTQTRSRSGQTTDATNFRSDVNSDGTINSGDQIAVRSRSGMFLP